jgi:hypothetical protein
VKVLQVIGPSLQTMGERATCAALKWVRVECPRCGKFICRATPGSTVEIVCNRCKTESVTTVAA